MITKADKNATRKKRHARVRAKISWNCSSSSFKCVPFKQAYLCSIN